jgi:ATP-dependent Clp protease ATP-binding subunit ClpA
MFERFTQDARMVVVDAQRYARESLSPQVEPMHLLVAMANNPDGIATAVLTGLGLEKAALDAELRRIVRRGGISDSDVEALGEFGIDVERIIDRVEETHGKGAFATGSRPTKGGHLPFSRKTKKVLELALREAVRIGDKHIGEEHVLLGLARLSGPATDFLTAHGIGHSEIVRVLQLRKAS